MELLLWFIGGFVAGVVVTYFVVKNNTKRAITFLNSDLSVLLKELQNAAETLRDEQKKRIKDLINRIYLKLK